MILAIIWLNLFLKKLKNLKILVNWIRGITKRGVKGWPKITKTFSAFYTFILVHYWEFQVSKFIWTPNFKDLVELIGLKSVKVVNSMTNVVTEFPI